MIRTALAISALAMCAAAGDVSIERDGSRFRVSGWRAPAEAPPGGWRSVLAVYAGSGEEPMLGTYSVEQRALVFTPRFPLSAGMRYRAVFHAPGNAAVEAFFKIPKADAGPLARIEQVYPTAGLLPENQLKFYLLFSAPMSRGEAWKHIRLLDASGAAVELPFLEIDQELWDRDYRRLTVLFDPGRIKRGLAPLNDVGPAIEQGKQYTLVIDGDWPDARGAPLERGFQKKFQVAAPDRTPPDTSRWRVRAPVAGTTAPVVVELGEPMDYALLGHMIAVLGPRGRVDGGIAISAQETRWSFTPREPWAAGAYELRVDTRLEDLAGNRIGRAFDVDTLEPAKPIDRDAVSVRFRIGR